MDLDNEQVAAFLLSFVSYYLKELNANGYKVANLEQLMLRRGKAEYYAKEANLENFI